MVFTDGETYYKDRRTVKRASAAWKGLGAKVYAVGIGPGISDTGLQLITGGNYNIIKAKSFTRLAKKAKDVLTALCKTKSKPKPKPKPKPPVVRERIIFRNDKYSKVDSLGAFQGKGEYFVIDIVCAEGRERRKLPRWGQM